MNLVRPSLEYQKSYIEALQEFLNESLHKEAIEFEIEHFAEVVAHMDDAEQGKNLRTNEVPRSEFWLTDSQRYLGKIQIRHKPKGRTPDIASHIYYEVRPSERGRGYGTQLLREGLKEAKKIGLHDVIITCDKDNFSSKKIIEANGGKFIEEIFMQDSDNSILKYHIFL